MLSTNYRISVIADGAPFLVLEELSGAYLTPDVQEFKRRWHIVQQRAIALWHQRMNRVRIDSRTIDVGVGAQQEKALGRRWARKYHGVSEPSQASNPETTASNKM